MKKYRLRGLTLVELILAIAIMGIIFVGFIGMFSSALINIFDAGHKGNAYNISQKELANQIALGTATGTDTLTLTFGTDTINIKGNMITGNETVNGKSSTISAFLPAVPIINILDSVDTESEPLRQVVIQGINTHFSEASTMVQIFDKTGTNLISTYNATDVTKTVGSEEIRFTLSGYLLNENTDHIIAVKTTLPDTTLEVVRAKFTALMPNLMAVSNSKVYVSANGVNWIQRNGKGTLPSNMVSIDFPLFGNGKYMVFAENNKIYKMANKESVSITALANTFKNAIWANSPLDVYFAVNTNGEIKKSTDGVTWINANTPTNTSDYNALFSSGNQAFAVGEAGKIAYSLNGANFTENVLGTNQLNDVVATTGYYVIVGNNGIIYQSADGVTWSPVTSGTTQNLNAVAYGKSTFVAVGNQGTILRSTDGVTWASVQSGLGYNLVDIHYSGQGKFFAIGNNGTANTLLSSDDAITWTSINATAFDTIVKRIVGN